MIKIDNTYLEDYYNKYYYEPGMPRYVFAPFGLLEGISKSLGYHKYYMYREMENVKKKIIEQLCLN